MKLETRFSIGSKVRVDELHRDGTVVEIYINEFGVQYRCRYFDNAKPEVVTFFEHELSEVPQRVPSPLLKQ